MELTVQKGVVPRELGNLNITYQYVETGGYRRTLNYTYNESQKQTDTYNRRCLPYEDTIAELGDELNKAVCRKPGVTDMLTYTPYPDSNNDPSYATWTPTPRTVTDPLGGEYYGYSRFQLKLNGSNIFTVTPGTGGYTPPVGQYESVTGSLCVGMAYNYCIYSNQFDLTSYTDSSKNVKPMCTIGKAREYTNFAWDYIYIVAQHDDRQHPSVCTGVYTIPATTYTSTQGATSKVPSKAPMMDCYTESIDVTTFELTVTTS